MEQDRIERSWTVRFKDIGPVVVNNVGQDSRDEAIRQAIEVVKRSYPDRTDFDLLMPATYTEIHLGPIVIKDKKEERKRHGQ